MIKKSSFLFFAILFSLLSVKAQVQDKAELEKERQLLQQQIKEAQSTYNQIKGKSKQAISQLSVINRKINLQERYIGSLSKEIRLIEDDLYLSNLEIYRLQKQLDTLKAEYAKTLIYAYKNRSSYDYLNFIFSASNFNDAVKRISYLKSYRTYREKQAATILETQQLIINKQQHQKTRKGQQSKALVSQTTEKKVLDEQKKEKGQFVGDLKKQEGELRKEIATKRKKDADLKNSLTALVRKIRREEEEKAKALAKKREEEERKKVVAAPTRPTDVAVTNPKPTAKPEAPKKTIDYLESTEKDIALGSSFSSNKGKLPWPVQGSVVTHFGTYSIEGTSPPLKGDNPGLTIATEPGANVKAVFDGEVKEVFNVGDGMMVVIKHGKYFTVYSNLGSISVKKGTVVTTNQSIGKAGKDEDGSGGQIDFVLMIESNNVNPESWLRR